MKKIIIGSRGSKLALRQTNAVADKIKETIPDIEIEIKAIKTKGDKILDVALSKINDKGLFTKELDIALLNGEIDIAVHSAKDIPSEHMPEIGLFCVPERPMKEDVVISRENIKLEELKEYSVIGTCSTRRKAIIKSIRKDFIIRDLRGNLETRIRKLFDYEFDAIILSGAGVKRMGMDKYITEVLKYPLFTYAVGQGAIGVMALKQNKEVIEILNKINDEKAFIEVYAERKFLKGIDAGCQVPAGVWINTLKNEWEMFIRIYLEEKIIEESIKTSDKQRLFESAYEIGKKLKQNL